MEEQISLLKKMIEILEKNESKISGKERRREKMSKEKIKYGYLAKVDRISGFSYGRVLIGSITYHFLAEDIKDAYQLALKKGEEVFGQSTFDEEGGYNQVSIASVPGIRNEEWKEEK